MRHIGDAGKDGKTAGCKPYSGNNARQRVSCPLDRANISREPPSSLLPLTLRPSAFTIVSSEAHPQPVRWAFQFGNTHLPNHVGQVGGYVGESKSKPEGKHLPW